MRSAKRAPVIIGLLLTLMLSLTACMHVDRNVSLNSDGSGSYALTVGFSDQLVSLASAQISTSMNSFGDKIKQQGGSYRHFEDTGYSYWAYTRPFKSIDDLNKMIQETPQSSDSSGAVPTAPTTASSDTLTFSEKSSLLSNTFHVTGHMSMVTPQGTTDTGGVDISQYLKDMRESFSVTMPGSITSHKGGVVSGNTVTYTIHYGEQTDIDVVGGGLNVTGLLPYGIGAAALLLVIIGVVVFLLTRRRKPAPAFASAAPQVSAMDFAPTYTPASPDAPTVATPAEPASGEGQL